MKPTGGEDVPGTADEASPQDELLEQVLNSENMRRAWARVKANKGASGVDGMSISEATVFIRRNWEAIRSTLENGRYCPRPVRRVEIPKPDGSKRPLGIPTVLDRLIQQAIAQVLIPIFDPHFSDSSYGFRPGRSAHDAVRQVKKLFRSGHRVAIDADLSKFFDTVNHDVLMRCVEKRVKDKGVLRLIRKYLTAGVMHDGRWEPTRQGAAGWPPFTALSKHPARRARSGTRTTGTQIRPLRRRLHHSGEITTRGRAGVFQWSETSGAQAEAEGQ
jgi:RNA-directed DNA polymerase